MRSSSITRVITSMLLPSWKTELTGNSSLGQYVCVSCAVRYGLDARVQSNQFLQQSRAYKSSPRRGRPPAAAAIARDEEQEEEPTQYREQQAASAWINYDPNRRIATTPTPAVAPRAPPRNSLADFGLFGLKA